MNWRDLVRDELRNFEPYQVPRVDARLKLDANESPYALPDDVRAEIGRIAADAQLNRYPDPQASELRGIVAEHLEVEPTQLTFGNGSDELIPMILQVFGKPMAGQSRVRVAYPVPTFSMFRLATLAAGATAIEIPLRADFEIDEVAFDRQITGGKPSIVFLARPNNPTGTLWPREVIEKLLQRKDLLVVVDEAYADYTGDSMASGIDKFENLVVMRSLSKIGLAGIRLGFLVGRTEVVREIEKVRLPYNIGNLTQSIAVLLMGKHHAVLREHHEAIVAERIRISEQLSAQEGIEVFPSEANFVLIRVANPGGLYSSLIDHGILVRNLSSPGPLEGCLRITVGTPEENEQLIEAVTQSMPAKLETE